MVLMESIFDELFILDLANNHQGDKLHAKTIITEVSEAAQQFGIKAAIKFQFRNLDTFVHKDSLHSKNYPMVERFLSTRLSDDAFLELKNYAQSLGLLTACTPFDEFSVQKIVQMGFDYIKVASCSADDWPLLEAIHDTDLPLIISTGGMQMESIDYLVMFLLKKRSQFVISHCSALYPSESSFLHLDRIRQLCDAYPELIVGWSSHEEPDCYDSTALAYALGARVFERHVGKQTDTYSLNRYSLNNEQIKNYFATFVEMKKKIYVDESLFLEKQKHVLQKLKRGAFLKNNITTPQDIAKSSIYYAFPAESDNVGCQRACDMIKATQEIGSDQPLTCKNTKRTLSTDSKIDLILVKIRLFMRQNKFRVPFYESAVLSFHNGLDSFDSIGALFIACVSFPFVKKYILMLPGQKHPSHMHPDRKELFVVIAGELVLNVDDKTITLAAGEKITIDKNVLHEFLTVKGVIVEELSYTEDPQPSVYKDDSINRIKREDRTLDVGNDTL
jgi:sialic acid synthase SpsE